MLLISPEFLEFRNSNLSPLMLLVGETPFDVWILLAFDSCWSGPQHEPAPTTEQRTQTPPHLPEL